MGDRVGGRPRTHKWTEAEELADKVSSQEARRKAILIAVVCVIGYFALIFGGIGICKSIDCDKPKVELNQ